ncbi:MAG TPA: hypothetical protein VFH89_02370 [Sphingomicrobium sp.]|nr:hypothetical protein [Sphingomicrobium sp.]
MKLNGGIVLIDPETAAAQRIIAFEINPDTVTRTFQVRGVAGEGGDRAEGLRLKGPPVETLKLEVQLDALIGSGNATIDEVGLHPQLAALELLVYPASTALAAENSKAASGTLEIAPAMGPLPLLVWGPKRIVPVRVTELSITEEEFDENLNPVRAKVSLGLRVLTVDDLGFSAKGGNLFMTHLVAREQLAGRAPAATFGALGIDGIP